MLQLTQIKFENGQIIITVQTTRGANMDAVSNFVSRVMIWATTHGYNNICHQIEVDEQIISIPLLPTSDPQAVIRAIKEDTQPP